MKVFENVKRYYESNFKGRLVFLRTNITLITIATRAQNHMVILEKVNMAKFG